MFAFLVTTAALAMPAATPQEETTLATGVPVVRGLPAANSSSVKVVGFVDVHATEDQLWRVLLDFKGRLPTNPTLSAVTEYKPAAGNDQWWAFEVTKFGVTLTYHNHYALDRLAGKMTHELDATQKNDLTANKGTYEVGKCAAGAAVPCTRLAWTVETDFGRSLPGPIRSWLGKSAVDSFLVDIAARAPKY